MFQEEVKTVLCLSQREIVLKLMILFNQKRALQHFVARIFKKDVDLRMKFLLLNIFQAHVPITLMNYAILAL